MGCIRIAIVDDHQIFIDGLKCFLDHRQEFCIVITALHGQSLLDQVNSGIIVDVIIIDLEMPVMNGFEATELLKRTHSSIKIIACSMHDNRKMIQRFKDIGGDGYILKNQGSYLLDAVILKVFEGAQYFPAL